MNYKKILYYSGNDLAKPIHPSKLVSNSKSNEDENSTDINTNSSNDYKIMISKYNQEIMKYKDELERRKKEFLKELSTEHDISYQKAKKLYNQCIINISTNDIFQIHDYFQELVSLHKKINNK